MTENEQKLIALIRSAKDPSALYAVVDTAIAAALVEQSRSMIRQTELMPSFALGNSK